MRLADNLPSDKDIEVFRECLKHNSFAESCAMMGRSHDNTVYHVKKTARFLMKRSGFPMTEIDKTVRFVKNIIERRAMFANLLKDYDKFLSDPSRMVSDPMVISMTISEFKTMINDLVTFAVWQAMVEFEPRMSSKIKKERKLKFQMNRKNKLESNGA